MAFTDMTGKQVPNVTFHTQQDGKWVDVTTDDLFKGKKVVLFALPGAFTPTCSSMHLPRYNELAEDFKKLGVDDIVCVSVNDTFVMNAWAKDQDAKDIKVIPDGNGEFTDTYFGVSEGESLSSGYAPYDAGGGIYAARLSVEARYEFLPDTLLMGRFTYSRLLGDAADSPIVHERNQPAFSIGVARHLNFRF